MRALTCTLEVVDNPISMGQRDASKIIGKKTVAFGF